MLQINNLKKAKKSQLIIFAGAVLVMLLIIIYSLETNNTYINKSSKIYILDNVIYEVCAVSKGLNSSNFYYYSNEFTQNISNFCNKYDFSCIITIFNKTTIPPSDGNWSKINYTDYEYNINFQKDKFNYNQNFTCT